MTVCVFPFSCLPLSSGIEVSSEHPLAIINVPEHSKLPSIW
jgi:hypothetical protein